MATADDTSTGELTWDQLTVVRALVARQLLDGRPLTKQLRDLDEQAARVLDRLDRPTVGLAPEGALQTLSA